MVSFPMAKLIFVVVLGLISASEQCQYSCPEGWKVFNNRCFQYFESRKFQAQAESFCVAQGGNLASVHSAEEDNFLKDLAKAGDPTCNDNLRYWIGLTDSQKEGTWQWTDGSQVDYTRWYKGQPDNAGNADCVAAYWRATVHWVDISCTYRHYYYGFICVKRPVPAGEV